MKPLEDALSPEDVALQDRASRKRLIQAVAIEALAARGVEYIELFRPHIEKQLEAINLGPEDPVKVLAVDKSGTVRIGPSGPMGANDLIDEMLAQNPDWKKHFYAKRQ